MTTFYSFPEAVRILTSVSAALCAVIQAIAVVYGVYLYGGSKKESWLENMLQIMVLCQLLILVYLIGQVQQGSSEGYLTISGQCASRYVICVLLAVIAVMVSRKVRLWYPLLVIPAAALTLPVMEEIAGSVFPVLYGVSLLFFCGRSIHVIMMCKGAIAEVLSAYSVKAAIDELPAGILFCNPNGYIILINTKMQQLMTALTNSVLRNGNTFYNKYLLGDGCLESCEKINIGQDIIYRIPDQTVWFFTRREIVSGKNNYIQLAAVDITEQWNMTVHLQEQKADLEKRSNELKQNIADMYRLYHEEETMRMKGRFHDILGQRIALLLQHLRENKEPDEKQLAVFTDAISNILHEEEFQDGAQQKIDTLRQVMKGIGVALHLTGAMPEEEEMALLYVDIIMEAVTNAVRHGFATAVYVQVEKNSKGTVLQITDNGIPPLKKIIEGGGLTGIRQRLHKYRGALEILTFPQFQLSIFVP